MQRGINESIHSPKWGTIISELPKYPLNGLWIKLNEIPVIQPWQAPHTWGELQQTLLRQDIDLLKIIQKTAKYFRDGKPHILMLGFPIPELFFGKNIVMNWKAIKLPVLSYGNKFAHGFRNNEVGYWQRDRTTILRMKFYRGVKNLAPWLSELWSSTREFYLGEWHFHPSSLPTPSRTDIEQMNHIANDPKYHCPEPILFIIGGNPNKKWYSSCHIFLKGKT